MSSSGWKRVAIKSVIEGLYDGPHATPKPADSGPTFLGIKNISEDGQLNLSEVRYISESEYPKWTRRVIPQPGDIVFTYEATLNRYAIIPKGFRGCLGRRLALIRPDPARVDTRFLHYCFFGEDWRNTISENTLSGATVDRIPLTKFPEFKLSLPGLSSQRKISAVLSAYDDLIENNTRRIAILEEMAQTLYREWFVHFRFPGHEDVKMVEVEGYGMVPEEWKTTVLGDIAKEKRTSVKPSDIDPETPYIGLGHMPKRSIALSDWGMANEAGSTKLIFSKGDILFGKIRPYFHKVGVAPVNGVCSTDTIVIVPKSPEWFSITLGCVSSSEFVDHATQTSKGTKMPRADWNVLVKYPITIPSEDLLINFNQMVENIVKLIRNHICRNANLRQTRDLLLPRLISGELDVAEVNILDLNDGTR